METTNDSLHEQWAIWEPIPELSATYQDARILQKDEMWALTLVNNKETIKIKFIHGICAHMVTPHSSKVQAMHAEIPTESIRSFYQASTSPYLHWITEQSREISNLFPLIHFVFIVDFTLFDVIAPYEPIVTRENS
jgi:hypothetical protein